MKGRKLHELPDDPTIDDLIAFARGRGWCGQGTRQIKLFLALLGDGVDHDQPMLGWLNKGAPGLAQKNTGRVAELLRKFIDNASCDGPYCFWDHLPDAILWGLGDASQLVNHRLLEETLGATSSGFWGEIVPEESWLENQTP